MSAIKKNDSFLEDLESSIAGITAPKIFPKWGVPVL
jgi:hypothetical protein